jgi:hypothetical protein
MLLHVAHSISLLSVLAVPAAHSRAIESTGRFPQRLAQVAPTPPAQGWRNSPSPTAGWRRTPPAGGWRGTPPTPPPPPVEHVERRKGFVWVQGDYRQRDGDYVWEGGHWERERPGMRWHAGHWEWQGNQYVWISGQWIDGAAYIPPPAFVVTTPPPSPPVVVQPPPPSRPGFFWIPASNEWQDGRYVRVEGRWEPERADKRWEAGHWDRDGDRNAWHPGGWQRRPGHDDDHDGDRADGRGHGQDQNHDDRGNHDHDGRRGPQPWLPFVAETSAGGMEFTVSYSASQTYVEAFVRRNGAQIAAGNIVQSSVVNADGTFSYHRLLPPSSFHPGDAIDVRFYSYVSGNPGVFIPGPTATTWSAPVLYH